MSDVKLYRGQHGFYELIREARNFPSTFDDYATGKSEFVTSIFKSDSHEYTLVEDIDMGVYYSIERKALA